VPIDCQIVNEALVALV